ncbi:hypothetical protein [Pleomorphovibrio marinus]|uniref:hypothetical protein n=1 Tax=Pleomorphovibrio marinus TaxID=2164132 RepID=UPI0018E4DB40|nr:hypothetical protein [Pleomorphovibrio marinus]
MPTRERHSIPFMLIFSVSLLLPISLFAQAPKIPTPVEMMAGHDRLFFQMVVTKKFAPESRFGFLSVSTFSTDYSNGMENLDLVMPVMVNYTFYKNIGLVAGTTVNNQVGFSPLAGLQHAFANREWVAVSIASFFLNSSRNVELFGIYEYKPKLSTTFDLYTRLQYMYIHGFSLNQHARSFLQLRTGLKKEAFSFGVGANLDQYGPEKVFKPNYGVFVGWAFQ